MAAAPDLTRPSRISAPSSWRRRRRQWRRPPSPRLMPPPPSCGSPAADASPDSMAPKWSSALPLRSRPPSEATWFVFLFSLSSHLISLSLSDSFPFTWFGRGGLFPSGEIAAPLEPLLLWIFFHGKNVE